MKIKVIFVHNDDDLREVELDVLPQNSDLVYLEKSKEYQKYIVLNRVWVFGKKEYPYVKVELAKR